MPSPFVTRTGRLLLRDGFGKVGESLAALVLPVLDDIDLGIAGEVASPGDVRLAFVLA